jgi:hypothetical protein
MDDPCYKVLPAALEKYNIHAPWENHAVYLSYDDKERCVGMDEKPLRIYKELVKEGKKPLVVLRKLVPISPESTFSTRRTQNRIYSVE